MKKDNKNKKKIWDIFKEYVNVNLKQYLIISCLFIIGIVIGVMVLNYTKAQTQEQVNTTINTCIENLKSGYEIDYIKLMRNIVTNHILTTLLLWFLGCSVIGIPIMYMIIAFKGFSLGYTISSIILTIGNSKGIPFVLATLLLQNILIIPAIISIGVSSMNLYKSIMKNKRMENIKIEIIRHTIFSFIMLVVLTIASFVEVYLSTFLLKMLISINVI